MIDISFFEHLYQFCDEGFIEIRKLPSRKQDFIPLTNLQSINNYLELQEHHYFGVALRNGNGGTKEHITQIPALYVDCDYKDTPREILIEKFRQLPFKPSIVIKSGGGVHLYFILKEPATQDDIPTVENLNRRLASLLGGDFAATDASRILRIPGTMNIKYDPPEKCEVVKKDSFFYNLEDFLDVLPEVVEQKPQDIERTQGWLNDAMMGVNEGERESTAASIAGYWINKISPEEVLTILRAWNINNSPPLEDARLVSTIKSISRYEPEKERRVELDNVFDSKRMVETYIEHIKSLKNNRFITGITEIDKRIRGVAGGEVLTIIARAGSFKTAMLQNLLKNYIDHSAWGAVFFSIEMPVASITERYFQILDGALASDVEKDFVDPERIKSKEIASKQFIKDLKNLYIVPSKISLTDIPKYISLIETEYNTKIGVIGIDYLGLIDGVGTNEYEIVSRLARGIKHIAKITNLPTIILSQVSRKGADGTTEIGLSFARGSGAIEEGADFVLGLWQLEEENTTGLVCKILKNRKGFPGSCWKLDIIPETLTFMSTSTKYIPPKKEIGGY